MKGDAGGTSGRITSLEWGGRGMGAASLEVAALQKGGKTLLIT